ncbi:hypothetical protein FK216_05070 [Moraxellaceae bacterium AER2_44_116]|nr:hypothetical protein [Moraxellaceae bacterium]TQC98894.1 hypothetical protein FK216_05070 [Moraxellaceae bacterium AER2_44_116]
MSKKIYLTRMGVMLTLAFSVNVKAEDYFLTATQKKELLLRGQLHDEQQRLYDIWIVPGYVVPLNHVESGWRNAGEALQRYRNPIFYSDLKKYSKETWRYGHKDILKEFTFTGTKKAWQTDMATASQRTQKRVFGWWLAYPWGVFEATTESVLRLATGIPVGITVSASAYTLLPVLYMSWPAGESLGYASIEGTTYPLVASAWNTMIVPPLALLGQQPAPQRADGFWMKQVDDPNLQALADVVIKWQRQLALNNSNNETVATKDKKAKIQQLYQQIKELEQQVQQDEKQQQSQHIKQLLVNAQQQKPQLEAELQSKGLSLAMLARNRQAIKVKMSVLNLSFEDLDKLLNVLLADGVPQNVLERPSNDKTDPLQRTLDVLH